MKLFNFNYVLLSIDNSLIISILSQIPNMMSHSRREVERQTVHCLWAGDPLVKNLPTRQERQGTQVQFLGWEEALEEEMATHSGILD